MLTWVTDHNIIYLKGSGISFSRDVTRVTLTHPMPEVSATICIDNIAALTIIAKSIRHSFMVRLADFKVSSKNCEVFEVHTQSFLGSPYEVFASFWSSPS